MARPKGMRIHHYIDYWSIGLGSLHFLGRGIGSDVMSGDYFSLCVGVSVVCRSSHGV